MENNKKVIKLAIDEWCPVSITQGIRVILYNRRSGYHTVSITQRVLHRSSSTAPSDSRYPPNWIRTNDFQVGTSKFEVVPTLDFNFWALSMQIVRFLNKDRSQDDALSIAWWTIMISKSYSQCQWRNGDALSIEECQLGPASILLRGP